MHIVIPYKRTELKIPDGLSPEEVRELVETNWDNIRERVDEPEVLEPGIPEPITAEPVSTAVAPDTWRPKEAPSFRQGPVTGLEIASQLTETKPPSIGKRIKEKLFGPSKLYFPDYEPTTAIGIAEAERLEYVKKIAAPSTAKVVTSLLPMAMAGGVIGWPAALVTHASQIQIAAVSVSSMLKGMGAWMGVTELLNLGTAAVREDIDYKFGAGKGLPDVLGVKGGYVKTWLDVAEFIGKVTATSKGAGAATAIGGVPKFLVKAPWFKALTDREKGLLTLNVWRRIQRGENKVKIFKGIPDIMKSKEGRATYFREQGELAQAPGGEGGTLSMGLFPLPWFKGKPAGWSVSEEAAKGAIYKGELNLKPFIKFAWKKHKVKIRDSWDAEENIGLVREFMSTDFKATTGSPWPGMPAAAGKPGGPVEKLYGLIDEIGVKKAGQKLIGEYHAELQKRVAKAEKVLQAGTGEQAWISAKREFKGAMPKVDYEPLRPYFSMQEQTYMYDKIRGYRDRLFTRMHAEEALTMILDGKALRSGNRMRALSKIFGPEIAKAVQRRRPIHEKVTEQVLDVLNAPRAIMTSGDISATLRQGIFLVTRHPVIASRAFKAQIKALLSEDAAIVVDKSLDLGRFALLREQSGLYRAPLLYGGESLAARPEPFMSNLAGKLPIVKQSERAYITFTNKLRADAFDYIVNKWEGTGKIEADYKSLAHFMNVATGRGHLGEWGETGGAVLNALFFSPRFFASRFQIPWALVSGTPAVRKYAAGTIASYVGTGLTVLGLAKLGGANVELNPKSSDFGKMVIGRTRYDYWAGYAQIARYVTQIATNERKPIVSGEIYEIPEGRMDTFIKWGRSKTSPPIGMLWDFLSKETFRGEEFTPRSLKRLWEEGTTVEKLFDNPFWTKMMFLSVQDIVSAIRFQGLDGGFVTKAGGILPVFGSAVLGIGVDTYEREKYEEAFEKKASLAQGYYGRDWEDLSPEAQETINAHHPEIKTLKREEKFESREIGRDPYLRRTIKESEDAARKVKENLEPRFQEELNKIFFTISGLSRTLGEWRLTKERFDFYQQLTTSYLNENLAKLIGSSRWQGWDDDEKTDEVKGAVSDAKGKAKVVIEETARREMQKPVETP